MIVTQDTFGTLQTESSLSGETQVGKMKSKFLHTLQFKMASQSML